MYNAQPEYNNRSRAIYRKIEMSRGPHGHLPRPEW